MKVRDLTFRLWYAQNIIIVKWKDVDSCNDIDEIKHKALLICENHHLRSDLYKDINNMLVDSYGTINGDNNYLVIEVH